MSAYELKAICRLTGERKKGPAIRKLLLHALMMKRREEIAGKFLSGEWSADLTGVETTRATHRKAAKVSGARWR